ncbi:MAG: hypothetical protein AMJ46_10185 [Latescibacteria bacterium DG_63]|nr:MAG: hypothetical protein AMJ46_10185 [Latescibacteria bacterium DG_63]
MNPAVLEKALNIFQEQGAARPRHIRKREFHVVYIRGKTGPVEVKSEGGDQLVSPPSLTSFDQTPTI